MAEQKTTAGYIDISKLPARARGGDCNWPYDEWAKIPPDKALEVTELLDGVKPHNFQVAVKDYSRRHDLGLICIIRKGHVWVARPKAAS